MVTSPSPDFLGKICVPRTGEYSLIRKRIFASVIMDLEMKSFQVGVGPKSQESVFIKKEGTDRRGDTEGKAVCRHTGKKTM